MILEQIKRARNVGTPITALITVDQPNAVAVFANGPDFIMKKDKKLPHPPIILWDIVKGFRSLNKEAIRWLKEAFLASIPSEAKSSTTNEDFLAFCASMSNLVGALDFVFEKKNNFPEGSTLVLYNAHRFLDQESVCQALMNLRDAFKGEKKMVVMMGPAFNFTPESAIGTDIYEIDVSLPTPEEIKISVTELCSDNKIEISNEDKEKAVDALRGLAPFSIESAAALSVFKDEQSGKMEMNIQELWERKRSMIKQVKGLTMERPGDTFEALGGLNSMKVFAQRLFNGPKRPKIICFLDEIEKMFGGAQGIGDSSGTSQDQLGVVLSAMEDNGFSGLIGVGPPGTGKSAIARAIASTYSVPLFKTDLGAAKGSLVGQSEQQIRAMMKSILAITGPGGAFFIATCNRLESLPPELRRRFRFGLWFFDLPDEEERESIGLLQSKRYKGVKNDPQFWKEACGWSGANIRDCCELAYAMSITIKEASAYIVPAEKQDGAGVEKLRNMAQGKYLSASYDGTYRGKVTAFTTEEISSTKGRKIGEEM